MDTNGHESFKAIKSGLNPLLFVFIRVHSRMFFFAVFSGYSSGPMSDQLNKTYDPAAVEAEAWRVWEAEKCFHADPAAAGEPYTIVIPPPNVTGALHLGHAMNDTLQDILTRVHRMRGFNTLWIPGIDHAGIATQAVVEKQLKEKENKTRHDIGREELVRRIWEWKEQYGNRIVEQLKRLGCSCDWDRTRFTLDEMCARAVRETFFKLFKDGLIYRGKRLVNWDIQLQTSISDDEIYHETVKTSLWHVKYPIVAEEDFTAEIVESAEGKIKENSSAASAISAVKSLPDRAEYVVVATTRPETMLGDTAVAVHSQDSRWNWAIGKSVELPLTGRKIPIIADDILVDPKFGTGVVKVTPAHDPNDYAVWQRHQGKPDQIDLINILNPAGTLNENAGPYNGMKRDAARKKVVEDLTALGFLEKEEPYETQVGHSDRSKTPIEPYLSDQWYVKMAPVAEPALQVVRDGIIKFFPERHAQQYLSWLGEKRDWPISRQLWWGHRIPVWSKTTSDLNVFHEIDQLTEEALEDVLSGDGKVNAIRIEDADTGEVLRPTLSEFNHGLNRRLRIYVALIGTTNCAGWERCGFVQDPDVLDTWFSSALWPHSTLGWPEQTAELKKYYPTSVLLTGRDIITLWVARMVMAGMYNMGTASALTPSPGNPGEGWGEGGSSSQSSVLSPQSFSSGPHPNPLPDYRERAKELGIPFYHVAINPTILDGKGERMSKSKGNGVDPVDIIDTHGADALRFTLTLMATETQDVRMPVKKDAQGRNTSDKFDIGRYFANKLWNAARFALSSFQSLPPSQSSVLSPQSSLVERWIISRFNRAVAEADAALAVYRFDQYAKVCYDFFWRDFCDWYVEAIKPSLRDPATSARTGQILAGVLDGALRLLHPIIPFITETIWWKLNEAAPERSRKIPKSPRLIKAAWPAAGAVDAEAETVFGKLQEIVGAIRNARNVHKIDPKTELTVGIQPFDEWIEKNQATINLLAVCRVSGAASPNATRVTAADHQIWIEGLSDKQADTEIKEKNRETLERKRTTLKARLDNPGYAAKAPAHLVEQTKAELAKTEAELAELT
jgi:valyl-tRNA synthetase